MDRALRAGLLCLATAGLVLTGCGDDDGDSTGAAAGVNGGGPLVVVTTNILGDVVGNLVGDDARLEVVMPLGSDPHEFEPSAQQASSMREADALIANGYGFEESIVDAIEAAEEDGVPVLEAGTEVETLEFEGEHAEHSEEEGEHAEAEGEHDEPAAGSADPHWFTDPERMTTAVEAMAEFLADNVDGIAEAVAARAEDYAGELRTLSGEMSDTLSHVPTERRKLVTNHEVFGYFADRFDFEVVGAVIPSGTTLAEPSAGELAELAELIEEEEVPAIFGETNQPEQLAESLADEVGSEVEIVPLFTESLGQNGSGAETYLDMMRTDAELITEALTR